MAIDMKTRSVFATACKSLDDRDWHYQTEEQEDKLLIRLRVTGDDLPMDITFIANSRKQCVEIFSSMPFHIAEDKRIDAALAVSIVNNSLINGTFDFDIKDGEMHFRVNQSYVDATIGVDTMTYLFSIVVNTVDDYNDKFLMLGKGMLSWESFKKND